MDRLVLLACCLTACVPVPQKATASRPVPPSVLLERGRPVERTLAAGDVHRYRVDLAASEVLYATVDQRGLDVVVTWFAPDGTRLGEIDSPVMDRGPEPVIVEARAAGAYLIEIRPFAPPGAPPPAPNPPATYQARIDEVISDDQHAERRAKASIDSPRILALWKALRAKTPGAEETFWRELAGKTPIVEPYPADPKDRLVTFVFRAPPGTAYVGLVGGPTSWEHPMLRLTGSDTWTLTARMPADARFAYAFIPDEGPAPFLDAYRAWGNGVPPRFTRLVPDPHNASSSMGLSATALPGAPAQPWTETKPGVPAGKITPLALASTHLGETRRIGVYTPPGHDPTKSYPLIVAFDGEVYGLEPGAAIPLPQILDNLIAAKKIPPVVLALVASGATRNRDLPGSVPFARFIALELVPRLRADHRAGLTPAETILTGSSFGGLASLTIAFAHPDVVGNVLSQSGSFGYQPGEIEEGRSLTSQRELFIRQVVTTPRQPIRFYLEAGLFETDPVENLLGKNRRMRDVLEAKGYAVTYREYPGGHDYQSWRGTISDGLIELLARP